MAYLNSRYARLTLTDSSNPDNYLKGSIFWVGPIFYPTTGFLIEPSYTPSLEFTGSPGVQIYKNHLTLHLGGVSNAEYVALTSLAANLKGTGRMIVIPRPAVGVALAIAYQNQITAGSMITASSSHASYPDDNLASTTLYLSIWRSLSGGLSGINLTANLGSSKDIDIFALLGSNLTNSATVRVAASEVSNLTSPEYDTVSSVAAFDTTYSASVLRSSTPPFGRHFLWIPGITQTRQLWTYEAILCTWDPDQPITRQPQPTYPPTWEVELRFRMCED